MRQKELSIWLKAVVTIVFVCCAATAVFIMPAIGRAAAAREHAQAWLYRPCLIFFWISLVPVVWALMLAWGIAVDIGRDNSFCMRNALRLRTVSRLAAADTLLYLAAAITLGVLGALEVPGLLVFLAVMISGAAIAVIMAALSHLIAKAAVIKADNDLTI